MTRILHVLPPHDSTEAATQAALVSTALAKQHEFRTVRLGVDLPWRSGCNVSGWLALARLHNSWQPEVIHVWGMADNVWLLLGIQKRPQVRVVLSWRELVSWRMAWLAGVVSRRATRILVPTLGLAEAFADREVDSRQLVVMPDALDALPPCATPPSDVTARIPNSARVILAVGRWSWHDRWKDLIWAADLLKFLQQPVHLVLCGYGQDTPRVEQYRRQIEIGDRVHLRPSCELPYWLDRAEIFWSMRDDPGVSPWLLRFLRHGKPVVVSRTADHARVITDGVNGWLAEIGSRADLAKRTLQWLERPELAASIGDAARQTTLAHIDSAAVAPCYAEVYEAR